jgi:hypothetical protein
VKSLASPVGKEAGQTLGDPPNTIDFGADLDDRASPGRPEEWSLADVRGERLTGFEPETVLCVEVIGARTTARFVLTSLTGVDQVILLQQLERSSRDNRSDFAGIDSVHTGSPSDSFRLWESEEASEAADVFTFSRLAPPARQDALLGDGPYTWLSVESSVAGYLPGSVVYLTATSDPIVFGEAIVGDDGHALISGDVAVELLGVGEHRLRVVGTRSFLDISADSEGEIRLPQRILDEIALFDLGTDATIIVTGNNPNGGVHTVMRVVPLDPVSPWWTLWVIGWTAFLVLLARLRGFIRGFVEKSVASGAVVVSMIPALYLGWTSTVTSVAWWGLVMGLGLSLIAWFTPSLRSDKHQRDMVSA